MFLLFIDCFRGFWLLGFGKDFVFVGWFGNGWVFGFWFIISRFLRFRCGNRCFCGLIQLLVGNLRFLSFEGGFEFSVPFWIMGRSFDTVSTLGFSWIGTTVLKFTRSKN